MHGYQLMQAIADRSGGRWTPSPGAIYPTIAQLEDEGLVTVEAESGRKLVTLTDTGRERAQAGTDPFATWSGDAPAGANLRDLLEGVAVATRQIGRHGTQPQIAAAATLLDETRRALYLVLAGAATANPTEGEASNPTEPLA
jgi:DNA-binding PadR family transcriptional regulator